MRTRHARAAVVAMLALALPSCVREKDVTFGFHATDRAPRFNDKIRGDFQPLGPEDVRADPRFGFFRDNSVKAPSPNPNPSASPTTGVVSEIFPVSQTADDVTGALVQTPCLFVGKPTRGVAADELRLAWELIGDWDRDASEGLGKLVKEGREEVGMCTLSSPVTRLTFEWPEFPIRRDRMLTHCNPDEGAIELAVTLNEDDPSTFANSAGNCIVGHAWPDVVLEAYAPRRADADGLCPSVLQNGARVASHFDGPATVLNDAASACGMPPKGVDPSGDRSYRLSLRPGHSFGSAMPERWLSPAVMFVDGGRTVVRPMTNNGAAGLRWRTPVLSADNDTDKQWAENYMPTVRVDRVEILSRDGAGTERNETPVDNRLDIVIPRPSGGDAVVTCRGSMKDGIFSFSIPDQCGIDDVQLRALTPTYAPGYLSSVTPVTSPIAWDVRLSGLPSGRTPFIRFALRVDGTPRGALRISALKDFGQLQVDRWRQGRLVLRNEGGGEFEVRSIAFDPQSQHPGDFSFVVAGDPVDVPLPIEAVPDGAGFKLQFSADASDAALYRFKDDGGTVRVSLGDPARESGTEALTLYGHRARLMGNLLVRDDPGAVIGPPAGSPHPRPFSFPGFAERRTPFVLGPNQSVEIVVTARPTRLGVRWAQIRVDAVPIGDPTHPVTARGLLRVESLDGPQLRAIPDFLYVTEDVPVGTNQGASGDRWAVVFNVGSFDLQVTRFSIVGRDAARFALATASGRVPPFTLASGEHEDLQVVYTPVCDGSYGLDDEAGLLIESNGGNRQLPLYGSPSSLCP